MRQKNRINKAFYIMTVPMAILFFCFHTFPFLQGVFYSFTDWKGYGNWKFVGLRNYLHIFQDKNVLSAYLFTFEFAVCATILVNVLSLLVACALNAKIKCKSSLFPAVYAWNTDHQLCIQIHFFQHHSGVRKGTRHCGVEQQCTRNQSCVDRGTGGYGMAVHGV